MSSPAPPRGWILPTVWVSLENGFSPQKGLGPAYTCTFASETWSRVWARPIALLTSRTSRYWTCVVLSHEVMLTRYSSDRKRIWASNSFTGPMGPPNPAPPALANLFPTVWPPIPRYVSRGFFPMPPSTPSPTPTPSLPPEALSHLPAALGGTRFSHVHLFSLPGWASLSPTTGSSWPAPSCWSGTWSVVRGPSPRRWWAWGSQRRLRAPVTATCLPPPTTGPWLSAPLVKLPVSVYVSSLSLFRVRDRQLGPEGRSVTLCRRGSCLAELSVIWDRGIRLTAAARVVRGREKSGGAKLWITKSCPF